MVLRNYVTLTPDVPARFHFAGGVVTPKTITDPVTGRAKEVRVLEMEVDRLNGELVSAYFSITSEKLAADVWPYLERGVIQGYDFIIVATGGGFQRRYQVQVIPR